MVCFEKSAVAQDGEKTTQFLVIMRSRRQKWLQGLWELPTVEQDSGAAVEGKAFLKKLSLDVGRLVRARAAVTAKIGAFKHSITHHRIEVQLFRGKLRSIRKTNRAFRWISKGEQGSVSASSMLQKALRLSDGNKLTDPAGKC
jgi:adenine-specific DNA glycosylase